MCGIAGYCGEESASKIVTDILSRLEYRGYDSAGEAFLGEEIKIIKSEGKLSFLKEKIGDSFSSYNVGIGHTRWATHGKVSEKNAHPLVTPDGKIALVHNGIIENHEEIKNFLLKKGYSFSSETDTEAALLLIHYYYSGDILKALERAQSELKGSYAFALLFSDHENEIALMRNESPICFAKKGSGMLIASDPSALFCENVFFLENKEIALVKKDSFRIFKNGSEISREPLKMNISNDFGKGDYPHFMLKEIFEEPTAVRNAYLDFDLPKEYFEGIERVYMVACGSSYNACHLARSAGERFGIECNIEVASEFRYKKPRLSKNDLVIFVSQSGETADTLSSLRYSKEKGAKTLAIVNAIKSSIARESERVLYTNSGKEYAVATTKAYMAQAVDLVLIILEYALFKNQMDLKTYEKYIDAIKVMPDKIEKILSEKETYEDAAKRLVNSKDAYFIGRRIDYSACLEASLKLKEISYIHSEAYQAGELKHGTISLIEEGTPVFVLSSDPELYMKTASNAQEVKARGALVISVFPESSDHLDMISDISFRVPDYPEILSPILSVVPIQLFSYYMSVQRGINPDMPRNLAKSVTVE